MHHFVADLQIYFLSALLEEVRTHFASYKRPDELIKITPIKRDLSAVSSD